MTLQEWVKKCNEQDESKEVTLRWEIVHALSATAAEFWLRAFCDEVEKRAMRLALANSHGVPHDPNFVDYSDAFDELRRELLGEK